MMPTETIGLVMEKMRNRVLCAIGAGLAGFCRPSASNQPIWPRRATIMVTPGDGSLVDVALERVRHALQPDGESPSDSGLAWGRGGVCGAAGCLAAVCAVMVSLPLALVVGRIDIIGVWPSLAQNIGVEQGVNRFALAIGPWPMLETARISGDAWFPQGCSSVGRVPVSKTGCRRFEPCRPCQFYQRLTDRIIGT